MDTIAPLATSPEFRAFLSLWEGGQECPVPLSDWLRDQGRDGAADLTQLPSAAITPRLVEGRIVLDLPLGQRQVPRVWDFRPPFRIPPSVLNRLPRTACGIIGSDERGHHWAKRYVFASFSEAVIALLDAADDPQQFTA